MRRARIFLLTCLFVFSLAHSVSAETETQVNISNSPPELIQSIPDILIVLDTPKLDAFDLDDYFVDLNGEDITFEHTPLNNITVTIDSENKVSFYPDIGYIGIQSMQFNASDTSTTTDSNTFQVTVGQDTIPPQWSSAKKNRATVYQNYHITFTTKWTDNVGLEEFIFSINQGLGWQNQTAVPFTGTSNTSEFKIQISAAADTNVSWRFYAEDVSGNINATTTQIFTVKEFTYTPGEGSGGDDSGEYEGDIYEGDVVGGVSYGTGDVELDYFEEGILAENLEVDTRSIKVSLKQGMSITRVVKIINTGDTDIKIIASLGNMANFATLGDTVFEIKPGETHELIVDFMVPIDTMPDQYFGFLILSYGDQISIPIVLDVKKFESEVELKVNLTEESKIVRAGDEVTALITIRNLKDITPSPSQFYYALKDFNGYILESANEEISLSSIFEEERSFIIPENTPDGEYIFYARIISEDSIDLDSETLLVGARFKIIALFKKFFYPIMILILLLILFFLYVIYKRNKKKKKLLELYLLLNELRGLVKKNKTVEAMGLYKRIKLTYGQHVSSGFLKDEAKLREELAKFSKVLLKTEKQAQKTPVAPEKGVDSSKTPPTKSTQQTPDNTTTKPTTPATKAVQPKPTDSPVKQPAKPTEPKPNNPVPKPQTNPDPKNTPQPKPVPKQDK